MTRLLPTLLLLLASCNKQAEEDDNFAGTELPSAGVAPAAVPGTQDAAALQERVIRAMAVGLPDSAGAQYRGLRAGAGNAACGEVAAASGAVAGIFRPFVVTPEGLAVVATTATIAWDDPDDFVADAYLRWCATPEELQRLAPQLQASAAKSAAAAVNSAAEEADLPLPPVRDETPPVPAPAIETPMPPPPARKKDAPPPRIDSFFNSVDRDD
jgi:hypothetical protein